ncbi:MFS general substrate transporter [Cylindrobasidium torrendii FP15055 ss-10]|uniref:MFS general substrate transporter n=1 Tax=Cylindrobasidium torrendii FP15055 ss-10 TaxID=1314674 RepID=A0A0D7BIM6_9AGAR|nr:MFS general substrate transporter [Cylindrobasidium torrendii FP15055 ss-10]
MLRFHVLTVGTLGMQLFWSVEQSYGSPYLLSIGLTKSSMAMVFIAGPLSGLIMQPLVGVLSDSCHSKFGRRRPYMVAGVTICVLAMLLLGFTRQVAGLFSDSKTLLKALGVLSIYSIDFAINAVMAVGRALLVDMLPSSDQPAANAWSARMVSVGSVFGFWICNLDLPKLIPALGDNELKALSIIASFFIVVGHLVTIVMIKEQVLTKGDSTRSVTAEVFGQFRGLWSNFKILPSVIKQIFAVQFFAWIGWFPVLFYTTVYVGDAYKREYFSSMLQHSRQEMDVAAVEEEAARLGSRALFYSSCLAMVGSFIFPLFVIETAKKRRDHNADEPVRTGWRSWRIPNMLKIHLASLWVVGQALFALSMGATFFTDSVGGSSLVIAATGFSWALTMWVPYALLGEAILTASPAATVNDPGSIMLTDTRREDADTDTLFEDLDSDADEIEVEKRARRASLMSMGDASVSRMNVGYHEHDEDDDEHATLVGRDAEGAHGRVPDEHEGGLSSKTGVILGLHNIFVVIPQFIVTGIASIIFAMLDYTPPAHHGGAAATTATSTLEAREDVDVGELLEAANKNSVVYVFRVAGISALIATILCYRLAKQLRHR